MNAGEYQKLYDSEEFKRMYFYDGTDLGADCGKDQTCFKLWSPLAQNVILNLYRDGGTGKGSPVQMKKARKGVWEYTKSGDCHGVYYDFIIEIDGKRVRTADPYAKACGCNGKRSMAVDLKRTNPKGWEEDAPPERTEEQIICEVHVRDFSNDENSGIPEAFRGKYKAFTFENTTLNGDGVHPTCMAYLKWLGVTHVQLMPVFDFASVDEAKRIKEYNWGYDPYNYNVPEGGYSTDPFHGEVRIRELKELVMALHKGGMRVVMDVVYNHTYDLDSWFSRTVPGYFYRQRVDGSYSDGSGCGNDLATEREMCGKYILESVLYWAREYHIDGFRFDLMGLMDVELINRIRRKLDETFGEDEIILYGEPWRSEDSPMRPGSVPCLDSNIRLLDEGVGVFCDRTRDAVKGHVFENEVPGFVNGGTGKEEAILHAVCAWTDGDKEFKAISPKQIISYVSAHDNLTLWDKLKMTLGRRQPFGYRDEEIVRRNRLAAAICFTCQGRPFFLMGEEAARTKQGDGNSYSSSPRINQIDWKRVYEYEDLVDYYRGLIAFRRRMPGLMDKSRNAGGRIYEKKILGEGCVRFLVDNRKCRWGILAVWYNSTERTQTYETPPGEWELLADGECSWHWKEPKKVSRVTVSPVSALILGCICEESERKRGGN